MAPKIKLLRLALSIWVMRGAAEWNWHQVNGSQKIKTAIDMLLLMVSILS
jgi:hypothetical protein